VPGRGPCDSYRGFPMSIEWFWTGSDGEQHGPFSGYELKGLVETGELKPTDWVKKAGMDKSVKASRVRGLFGASPDPAAEGAGPA
jgi:hypothetical protein